MSGQGVDATSPQWHDFWLHADDFRLSRASLTKLILARNSIRSLVLEPSDGSHVIDEVDFEDNSIQTISDLVEG